MRIKIGTRGSKLALIQAEYVKNRLSEKYPGNDYEIEIIKTKGDIITDKPLNQIGDKGLFVKEIEEKLLSGEIDLAVHSMKDMPSELPKGLIFSRSWKREDARDVLILREEKDIKDLKKGAVIGTGSVRRAMQLKRLADGIEVVDIRGNVDTRIKKMYEQGLDGIVLAAAGLKRLGMEDRISYYFDEEEMVSAPAQGILALELKEDNKELLEMLNTLSDEETDIAAGVEREFLSLMGGDCHIPVGAYCRVKNIATGECSLSVLYGKKDKKTLYRYTIEGARDEVAKQALDRIKKEINSKVYLVGAGPGDEGLITLRGMELIKSADCIIYDRLVSEELVNKCRQDCEKIYVGKKSHMHTMKQEDINKLLVKKAMQYDVVVRLKGGDPYVFGRGAEEALYLREQNISFEVIPGVTSAIAGCAYAGIPVTHRGISQGVWIVTAHSKDDTLAKLDFEAMARSNSTLVFMMGLSNLEEIIEGLINAGIGKNTGAAVIENATTPRQRTVISDVWNICKKVREMNIQSPAVIVIGEVTKLSDKLWFYGGDND